MCSVWTAILVKTVNLVCSTKKLATRFLFFHLHARAPHHKPWATSKLLLVQEDLDRAKGKPAARPLVAVTITPRQRDAPKSTLRATFPSSPRNLPLRMASWTCRPLWPPTNSKFAPLSRAWPHPRPWGARAPSSRFPAGCADAPRATTRAEYPGGCKRGQGKKWQTTTHPWYNPGDESRHLRARDYERRRRSVCGSWQRGHDGER